MPDLGPYSEPIVKLLDVVSKAVGGMAAPKQILRIAEAEAEATLIQAEANEEAEDIRYRASRRREAQELRRQENIDLILAKAASVLPSKVSSEPVDEDWVHSFFNACQDIGNEEMQLLWARILAGEVAKPGSFSLKSIETVRLLRQSDAAAFQLFCRYLWDTADGPAHYVSPKIEDHLEQQGFGYIHYVRLAVAGLTPSEDTITMKLEPDSDVVSYFGMSYRLSNHNKYLRVRILTDAGLELRSLCTPEPDPIYRDLVIEDWAQSGVVAEEVVNESASSELAIVNP